MVLSSNSPQRSPQSEEPSYFTRRAFLGAFGAVTAGLALEAGEFGRHNLVTERRTIIIPGLPEAFAGFRIAQISDIHFAEFTEPFFVKETVRRLNALRADMVLLTGDFVTMGPIYKTEAVRYAPLVAELLGAIECTARWGVLGNHDYAVNADAVTDVLKAVKIPILRNEYVPIERNGARIWLSGLMDVLSGQADIQGSVPPTAARDGEKVILMSHEPDIFPQVAKTAAYDFMLSGHTHGGQVRIPFLPPLVLPPLGREFVEGHFRKGRTQLYVNRGIGAVALPFRFRCPSELSEFTLQPA